MSEWPGQSSDLFVLYFAQRLEDVSTTAIEGLPWMVSQVLKRRIVFVGGKTRLKYEEGRNGSWWVGWLVSGEAGSERSERRVWVWRG